MISAVFQFLELKCAFLTQRAGLPVGTWRLPAPALDWWAAAGQKPTRRLTDKADALTVLANLKVYTNLRQKFDAGRKRWKFLNK